MASSALLMKSFTELLRASISLARAFARHPTAAWTVVRVWRTGLSMLGLQALLDLSEAAAWADRKRIPGIIVEAGTAWGGSGLVLAASRRHKRPVYLYDTFEGIPPPTEADGQQALRRFEEIRSGKASGVRRRAYYGYERNLLSRVRQSFAECGMPVEDNQIYLIPGLYQETLYPPDQVALAHLDCDWYESIKVCLERIVPRLAQGGRIIIDDYDYWVGCKRAVDEYFADKQGEFQFVKRRRLHVIRRLDADALPHH